MAAPFKVTVYDKLSSRKGWIGDPIMVRAVPRHNLLSTAEVTFRADHPKVGDVLAAGARLHLDYDGSHLIGGRISRREGSGPAKASVITVTVEDDWRLLTRMLCWPDPTAALSSQLVAYDNRTGNAETVVKGLILANATRLGIPVTIAPNLGRGATIKTSHRFHPLTDRLDLDAAGIGVSVQRDPATGNYLVDCYEPATYPRDLTEQSGVVQKWDWTETSPSATRAIAGNQGEAESRSFRSQVDSAREADWGDIIEVFLDARDTDDATETDQRMDELLETEGAPTAGLSVELSETDTFRYGTGVRVGDRVTLAVGVTGVTDVLREAVLTWTAKGGLLVTPTVGQLDLQQSLIPRAMHRMGKSLRSLTRS
jgi:hypothetical protein